MPLFNYNQVGNLNRFHVPRARLQTMNQAPSFAPTANGGMQSSPFGGGGVGMVDPNAGTNQLPMLPTARSPLESMNQAPQLPMMETMNQAPSFNPSGPMTGASFNPYDLNQLLGQLDPNSLMQLMQMQRKMPNLV